MSAEHPLSGELLALELAVSTLDHLTENVILSRSERDVIIARLTRANGRLYTMCKALDADPEDGA